MKEVRLKERIENAFEAFFDSEKLNEGDSLSLANYENSSSIEKPPIFSATAQKVFRAFKQIFLFLPGNFLLFFLSMIFTGLFLLRPSGGVGRGIFVAFLIFLLSALMTVVGLGNWREPKHYLIPLSTISIGVTAGIIGSILFGDAGFGNFLRNYVPYFFPLAFVTPVLMKSWLDKTEE